MRDGALVLQNLRKVYEDRPVVKDFTLSVLDREFVALLGPSGCGKSTILAMIAGFEQPDAGSVSIDGRSVDALPPHRRKVGLVMQDYAIFSRMTVRQNLEFGLKMQSLGSSERRARVSELVERLSLGDLLKRKGDALNLSEMQRVALARALITRPSLLLLDEPMSNLDASVRSRLRSELKLIQREFDQTILYVTHDQIEAMSMADRIAVMRDGTIEQIGAPEEVYRRPRNRYVAQFLGEPPINFIDCTVEQRFGEPVARMPSNGALPLPRGTIFEGAAVLAIRPHNVRVAHQANQHTETARVADIENLGAEHVLHLDYGDQLLAVVTTPGYASVGDILHLAFDLIHAHLIDPASGEVVASGLRGAPL
jgi:multiple sugar transport system ATP-binding protein